MSSSRLRRRLCSPGLRAGAGRRVSRARGRRGPLGHASWRPDIDADDIVQEVFIIASKRLGGFRGEAKLSTWLFRITDRVVRNHRRCWRVRRVLTRLTSRHSEQLPAADGDPGEALSSGDGRCGCRVLDALPDRHRRLLILFELEGLSAEEIGLLLGVRLRTVRVQLHRARSSSWSAGGAGEGGRPMNPSRWIRRGGVEGRATATAGRTGPLDCSTRRRLRPRLRDPPPGSRRPSAPGARRFAGAASPARDDRRDRLPDPALGSIVLERGWIRSAIQRPGPGCDAAPAGGGHHDPRQPLALPVGAGAAPAPRLVPPSADPEPRGFNPGRVGRSVTPGGDSALRAALRELRRRERFRLRRSGLPRSYDRRFPRGLLRQEVMVTRVEALLGAGRERRRLARARIVARLGGHPLRPCWSLAASWRGPRPVREALIDFLLVEILEQRRDRSPGGAWPGGLPGAEPATRKP